MVIVLKGRSWIVAGWLLLAGTIFLSSGQAASTQETTQSHVAQSDRNTDLIAAIKQNDAQSVLRLLNTGASANARDPESNNPALVLLYEGQPISDASDTFLIRWISPPENLTIARALLDHGADINAQDFGGYTPLSLAVVYKRIDSIRLLLDRGARVNIPSKANETALSFACRFTNQAVPWLLAHGAKVNTKDVQGDTPLLTAIQYGNLATMRLLIEKGADIHAQAKNCENALSLAVASGDAEKVRLLLKGGLNANQRLPYDERHSTEPWSRTPLMDAARYGFTRVAKALLEKGADINARGNCLISSQTYQEDVSHLDMYLDTDALHMAVLAGHIDMVKLLLERGAKIHHKDTSGRTPLLCAIYSHENPPNFSFQHPSGYAKIVQMLAEKGAGRGEDGKAALRVANRYRQTEIVALLKKYGAKE